MLELDLNPFPVLITERLVLRALTPGDAPALFVMRSDPQVMEHIARPVAMELKDVEDLIAQIALNVATGEGITWAITLKGDDTLIGTIGYYRLKKEHHRGEIGYMLSRAHRGRGIMAESLAAAVECGFQRFHFHTIEAVTDPRNTASNRALERQGFVREGLFKQNYLWNGEFLDSAVYSLLRPDPPSGA